MKRWWGLCAFFLFACDTALTVNPEGFLCDSGGSCPGGYECQEGVCRAVLAADGSVDLCANITCEAPPSPLCLDNSTLRTWAAQGSCDTVEGSCGYDWVDTNCQAGCLTLNGDSACLANLCGETPCATPPAPQCQDGGTLSTYAAVGTCSPGTGQCQYAVTHKTCVNGCVQGACSNQNLCANVSCAQPPPPACVGSSVRTYVAPGQCQSGTGQCQHSFNDSPCAGGCVSGTCIPPGLLFRQTAPFLRTGILAVDQVEGSGGKHLLAVGDKGFVAKWNGTVWSQLTSGTQATLRSVWLASANQGFIVGDNGTILRYDGSSLTQSTVTGFTANLRSVHGLVGGGSVFAVAAGQDGVVRFGGTLWQAVSLPSASGAYDLESVFVDSRGAKVAGRCGSTAPKACVVSFVSSGGSLKVDLEASAAAGFDAIGPGIEPGDVTFAARGMQIRRYDATTGGFDSTATPVLLTGDRVSGITRAASTLGLATWLLTGPTAGGGSISGALYRYSGTAPTPLLSVFGPFTALSRTDSDGVIVADGTAQGSSLFRRGPLTYDIYDLAEDWSRVELASNGDLWLANRFGDWAVRSSNGFASFVRNPGDEQINDLAVGSSFSLMVGASGAAIRLQGGTHTSVPSNTSRNLQAVCRLSDTEWYAVGGQGALVKYDGAAFSNMTALGTALLTDISCSPSVVAVGENGSVYRKTGGSWSVIPPPPGSPNLLSVGTNAGSVYVAGDGFFAVYRVDAWTVLPAMSRLRQLQVLGPNEIYAVSDKQVVRYNGTAWSTTFTASQNLAGGTSRTGKVVFAGNSGVVVEGG